MAALPGNGAPGSFMFESSQIAACNCYLKWNQVILLNSNLFLNEGRIDITYTVVQKVNIVAVLHIQCCCRIVQLLFFRRYSTFLPSACLILFLSLSCNGRYIPLVHFSFSVQFAKGSVQCFPLPLPLPQADCKAVRHIITDVIRVHFWRECNKNVFKKPRVKNAK